MPDHTWLWTSKDEKRAHHDTVTLPVALGLAVVVLAVLVMYIVHKRPSIAGRAGTHTVLEHGRLVRRSERSRKGVSRWSPDDLGTPTGMKHEREKNGSILHSVTPTALIEKVKEELPSPKAAVTPKTAKKTGRPRKDLSPSPRSPTPPRTRRATGATPRAAKQ